MPKNKKPVVAVYVKYYLSMSMTFVYRQLSGAAKRFEPIVLTSGVDNIERFPYEAMYVKPKTLFEKIYTRLQTTVGGRYTVPGAGQKKYWERILLDRGAKLIHAHFGPFGMEMLPIAKKLGIPLLVTFHGVDASRFLRDPRYVRGLKELFAYAHVITASQDFAKAMTTYGAPKDRLQVHYVGVPVDLFPYVEREAIREKVAAKRPVHFLQVSGMVAKKGHRYTLEAFSRFLKTYDNADLTIAGDGPVRAEIEALCQSMGLSDKVSFLGMVTTDTIYSLMKEADVFLHHCVTAPDGDKEATTTAIAEAMSTGLIIISTFHGGIPEMVDDGVNGFLVEERDVDAYVDRMVGVLDSDSQMGKRAAERIRTSFDIAGQNEKLMDIYQSVIDGGPPKS